MRVYRVTAEMEDESVKAKWTARKGDCGKLKKALKDEGAVGKPEVEELDTGKRKDEVLEFLNEHCDQA